MMTLFIWIQIYRSEKNQIRFETFREWFCFICFSIFNFVLYSNDQMFRVSFFSPNCTLIQSTTLLQIFLFSSKDYEMMMINQTRISINFSLSLFSSQHRHHNYLYINGRKWVVSISEQWIDRCHLTSSAQSECTCTILDIIEIRFNYTKKTT